MTQPSITRIRPITWLGLLISLFGFALFTVWFRKIYGITIESVLIREAGIFLLVGIVLWIVRLEGLTNESINLRFTSVGKSIAYGMLFLLFLFAGIALCLLIMAPLGWNIGGEEAKAYRGIPLWVWTIIVIRAGIAEELFFRGYAIERLTALTGSRWVAVSIPLLIFSFGHFQQGPGSVFIAFVLGAILTATYLWKKDLLANMICHFTVDFIPNVALPLLGLNNE